MKCGFCGSENDASAKKCRICGASLPGQGRPQVLGGESGDGLTNQGGCSPAKVRRFLILFLCACTVHDCILIAFTSYFTLFTPLITVSAILIGFALYNLGSCSKFFHAAIPFLAVETGFLCFSVYGALDIGVSRVNQKNFLIVCSVLFVIRRVLCFLGAAKISSEALARQWRFLAVALPLVVTFIVLYFYGPTEIQNFFVEEGEGQMAGTVILGVMFVIAWGVFELYIRVVWGYVIKDLKSLARREQEERDRF